MKQEKAWKRKNRVILSTLVALFLLTGPLTALALSTPSAQQLRADLDEFLAWQSANPDGVDFAVKNIPMDEGNMTSVALVVDSVDLAVATEVLAEPDAWCELMFLHLNVKACVFGANQDGKWVRLYMGRKFYQSPDKAEELQLAFKSGATEDGVSWVEMTAAEGPYGTSDYYIGLFAIESEQGVFVQFLSSQKAGDAATAAQKLYFSTLAANKVGFSIVGKDWRGKTEYVGGQQGALERNIVRYLLALEVYLQKYHLEGSAGFQERAGDWYDATTQYKKQLYEVNKKDYLNAKAREYQNQLALQE